MNHKTSSKTLETSAKMTVSKKTKITKTTTSNVPEKFVPFTLGTINNLNYEDAKTYLLNYFTPLNTGDHALLVGFNKYDIIDSKVIKSVYLSRIKNASVAKYYLKETDEVYTVIKDIF